MHSTVLLLALLTCPPVQVEAPRGTLRQVTADLSGPSAPELAVLLASDLDVLFVHPGGRALDLLCDDAELARLRGLGVPYRVVHEDLAGFYAARLLAAGPAQSPALGAWLSPPFGQGSLGGYYTWEEVGSVLDQIAAARPEIVAPKVVLGQSREGRDLWALKVSDDPGVDEEEPEVRFDALHHAREPMSMQSTLWALLHLVERYGEDPLATSIVDARELWFVPVVNPDGYVYNALQAPSGGGLWRKNRRINGGGSFGVDLNRNYPFQWGFDDVGSSPAKNAEDYRGPAPASEPETAAMVAFLAARGFRTALSSHTFSDVWAYPWGYTVGAPAEEPLYAAISAAATQENGYGFGPASQVLYLGNGTTIDHEHAVHGTLAWTPEIGSKSDGFWPAGGRIAELAAENLGGFLRTALAAGSHPHVVLETLADVGDDDGWLEPGETVELVFSLVNAGLDGTSTPVALSLESSHPLVKTGRANVLLARLDSLQQADNRSAPLTLAIEPAVPAGTEVSYVVRVEWDGLAYELRRTFVVGHPVPFVADDLEVELGWLAGQPGDTATDGLWEHGDPKKTTNSLLQIASPANDATPDPGVLCYITGNGSNLVNLDDVDHGFTTLVSPRIDLSALRAARLSYSRWYADLFNYDDPFEVSISNDDGATWMPLETVDSSTSEWRRASFRVEDFVPPTDAVRLRFVARDEPDNSTCEACVDDLLVEAFEVEPRFNVYGRPAIGGQVALHVTSPDGGTWAVLQSDGTAHLDLTGIAGPLLLDPATLALVAWGVVPASGLGRAVVPIPPEPLLLGRTLHLQGLVAAPGGLFLTSSASVTFE